MIIRSIKGRLLLALTLFVALSLGLSGLALEQAFRTSVETGLEEKLKANIYSLLADSNLDQDQLTLPEHLQNPDFNRLESGLYGLVFDRDSKPVWRSPSAITLTLPELPPAKVGHFQLHPPNTLDQASFYHFSYGVIWEKENGDELQYQIHLLQSAQPIAAELQQFRTSLWRWFTAAGLILLTVQAVMMRWGLRPLRRLGLELNAIEAGQQDQLNNQYPQELEHVTKNLNLLIAHERRQRQRYRNTLNDLAHSLKTPLTILRGFNSSSSDTLNEEQHDMEEQITRMTDIINHQLQRASSETTTINRLSMHPVPLSTLCDRLLNTLHKVYTDKPIQSSNKINSDISLRIDERDLMEVFGNL